VDDAKPTLEQLAATTDEQQIIDIRAAAEVALAAFNVWRQSSAWNRHEKHYQRWGALVDRVAVVLAELPADADLRTVIDAVRPLLNSWWPSSAQQEVTFSAAVDRLRYLTMWRPDRIHQAPHQHRAGTLRRSRAGSPPGPRPSDLFGVNYWRSRLMRSCTRSDGLVWSLLAPFGAVRCCTALLYWMDSGPLAHDYGKRPVSHPARCTGRSAPVCARLRI
jgi:hypothetical protein